MGPDTPERGPADGGACDGGRGALPPLLVVDGANVVGSVPDGWWRDRLGAAARLRDALVPLAVTGLPATAAVPPEAAGVPLEIVLVVEGAARGLEAVPGVRVASAPAGGDDLIAELAAQARTVSPDRPCLVATADRELRGRVTAVGALCVGPRTVRPR
jgi:hypothetical protein